VKSKLRPRILVPAGILALLTLGFGAFAFTGTPGGSEEPLPPLKRPAKTAEPAPSVSRSAWAKQANAICLSLNEDAAALGTAQSRTEMLELLPRSLDLADAALVELRALPAPRRDRRDVKRMLDLFARFIARERQAVAALTASDTAGFARFTAQAFAANNRGNAIARRLGADQCAENGSDESKLVRELEKHRVVVAVLYSPDSNVDTLAIAEARAGARQAGAGFVAIDVYNAKEVAPVAAQFGTIRGAPAVLVLERFEGAVTQFAGYVDRETVAQAVDNALL
jgi:hypothetical protein